MPARLTIHRTTWGRLKLRENDFDQSAKVFKKEDAMRFLLKNGFMEAPFEVVNILAYLITKTASGVKLNLTKEYYELSKNTDRYADSTREILSYYIEKNIALIRKSLIINYASDIGEYFCGNKNFIQKMSKIFAVFYS